MTTNGCFPGGLEPGAPNKPSQPNPNTPEGIRQMAKPHPRCLA
jgi:hypothetical protein